jgi:predicted ferric reductase
VTSTSLNRPALALPSSPTTAALLGRRARQDTALRTSSVVALWAGLLLVTYWWVADRGVQDLGSWTTALVSVGRLSGLVASVLLLTQVLLMARVPLLERAYGQDRLARIHRIVGFTSFSAMVFHIVTITWGYAAGQLLATPTTLWNLTWDYPGMLLAAAGTACLVMVVATSIRAARRRLRYESWHLLHLYAYLGVGLALPHQLWTGQQFTSSPGRTLFWWTAWGVTAGAVLVFRLGRPVLLNARHQLRVAALVPEGPGVWSVHITGRRLERLPVAAGQFLVWRFLGRPGWTRGNPYSLSAAPDGRGLRITVRPAGEGSAAVAGLRPGDRVLVEGPFGRLGAPVRTRSKVALIGAGVGMAPLRALAEELRTTRATPSCSSARPATPSSPASWTGCRATRGSASSGWAGTGEAPTPGSAAASTSSTTSRPCSGSCPTLPSVTCSSADPRPGPRASSAPSPRPGSRRRSSTSTSSAGDHREPHRPLGAQHCQLARPPARLPHLDRRAHHDGLLGRRQRWGHRLQLQLRGGLRLERSGRHRFGRLDAMAGPRGGP